jgi:hypothetical protein
VAASLRALLGRNRSEERALDAAASALAESLRGRSEKVGSSAAVRGDVGPASSSGSKADLLRRASMTHDRLGAAQIGSLRLRRRSLVVGALRVAQAMRFIDAADGMPTFSDEAAGLDAAVDAAGARGRLEAQLRAMEEHERLAGPLTPRASRRPMLSPAHAAQIESREAFRLRPASPGSKGVVLDYIAPGRREVHSVPLSPVSPEGKSGGSLEAATRAQIEVEALAAALRTLEGRVARERKRARMLSAVARVKDHLRRERAGVEGIERETSDLWSKAVRSHDTQQKLMAHMEKLVAHACHQRGRTWAPLQAELIAVTEDDKARQTADQEDFDWRVLDGARAELEAEVRAKKRLVIRAHKLRVAVRCQGLKKGHRSVVRIASARLEVAKRRAWSKRQRLTRLRADLESGSLDQSLRGVPSSMDCSAAIRWCEDVRDRAAWLQAAVTSFDRGRRR